MRNLVLAGFFGRGNAGDEALLQCAYEALSPHYGISIAANLVDTRSEFRSWYPYNEARIFDESSIAQLLEHGIHGLVIGGGGLHVGFAAHLAIATKLAGGRTILAGTDNMGLLDSDRISPAVGSYLEGFDLVTLRFRAGVEATRRLGVRNVHHGADWAFALQAAPPPQERVPAAAFCCIVVREWEPATLGPRFRFHIHSLVHGVRSRGLVPLLVPFCPEDEAVVSAMAEFMGAEVLPLWWNPRAIKGLFAEAALVVSVGRLHPLIFAAPLGTPVCHLAPVLDGVGRPRIRKLWAAAEELRIAGFDEVDELLRALDAREIGPACPEAVDEAQQRHREMLSRLLETLEPVGSEVSRSAG